jgi:hypothetical protein
MLTPLKRPVSTERPLLICYAPSELYLPDPEKLSVMWESLDPVVREHATIHCEGHRSNDFANDEAALTNGERLGIPITLQIQGDNGDRQDTMPFDRVRSLLDRYDSVVGLQIVEASQRTFVNHQGGPEYSMGRNARYARDIIRLAGEYGVYVSFQLMRENYIAMSCSVDNEALFDAIQEHHAYVIPMHEMNCEYSKFTDHLGAMGLWLSEATDQWGVEAQSWYWSDNGYDTPGTCHPGTLDMPGELYAIMFLTGASAGAAAYSIEPPQDMWSEDAGWRYRDWMGPVFKRLVDEKLIPTRDEVRESTPLAYHLDRCENHADFHRILDDLDFDHGEGRLLRATYGVYERTRDSEFIPNNPRYGWIPALPPQTPDDVLAKFRNVTRPGKLESVEDARALAEGIFPPVERGDAWSLYSGPFICAANSHEFWPEAQSVRLTIPRRPDNPHIENGALSWLGADGDTGYHVWRLRNGVEELLTPKPITSPSWTLNDSHPNDLYAISAITTATEQIAGTLHLHTFLLLNGNESRRSTWIGLDQSVVERYRIGETIPDPSPEKDAAEKRAAKCTLVEDLGSPVIADDDPHRDTKYSLMASMSAFKQAVEAEDVEGVLAFHTDDYREPSGRTAESVRSFYDTFLWSRLSERFAEVAEDWSVIPAWSNPAFRLLVREWNVKSPRQVDVTVAYELWAGTGPEFEPSDIVKLPFLRDKTTCMTWIHTDAGWRLQATAPALFEAEDLVSYRLSYQGW